MSTYDDPERCYLAQIHDIQHHGNHISLGPEFTAAFIRILQTEKRLHASPSSFRESLRRDDRRAWLVLEYLTMSRPKNLDTLALTLGISRTTLWRVRQKLGLVKERVTVDA